ncbi:MAG: hypothetical protein Q4P34_02565 [Tissierellia bacterium]|nr:hypothetical protein [Tissierellia bacterium]
MLNKLKYKFSEFMIGRYGLDKFGRRLQLFFFISLIISFLLKLNNKGGALFFEIATLLIIIFLYYRIFSKDIFKMRKQQEDYFRFERKITIPIIKLKRKIFGTKSNIYISCPYCKDELRLPRGKGKLKVTCPKCKKIFIRRT